MGLAYVLHLYLYPNSSLKQDPDRFGKMYSVVIVLLMVIILIGWVSWLKFLRQSTHGAQWYEFTY